MAAWRGTVLSTARLEGRHGEGVGSHSVRGTAGTVGVPGRVVSTLGPHARTGAGVEVVHPEWHDAGAGPPLVQVAPG